MNRTTTVVFLAAGIVLSGCQSSTAPQSTAQAPAPTVSQPAAEPHKLSGEELRAHFAVPFTAYSTTGSPGPKNTATYFADGKMKMHSPQMSDTGTYRLTDDGLYCSTYTKLRGGAEACQTVYKVGDTEYETKLPNGTTFKSTHVPGNPEGL